MTFKKWYSLNHDKLQEQYEEYQDTVVTGIYIPMTFDEFVQDKWDSFDGYTEKQELY